MQRDILKQSTGPLLTPKSNLRWRLDDSTTIQKNHSVFLVISYCLTVAWLCYPLYLIPMCFGSVHPWDIIPICFGSVYPLVGISYKIQMRGDHADVFWNWETIPNNFGIGTLSQLIILRIWKLSHFFLELGNYPNYRISWSLSAAERRIRSAGS